MRPILVASLLAACGASSESESTSAIHAEIEPLKGFAYDSGQVPGGAPVQVDFKAGAGGKLTLDADPGAPGVMAIDAGIQVGATIKSTIPGAEYDGPLQGLPNIDIKIQGDGSFDPSALGASAKLDATVSPAELGTIPLATALGIPAVTGDLTITLQGGTVTSTFTATCANAGHFAGTIDINGTVTLGGSLKVVVPIIGEKTFDLGALAMPIPTVHLDIVFATPDDPQASGCSMGGSGGGGTGGGGTGGGGTGGGGTPPAPNQQWDIIIKQAAFSANDYNGGTWDPSGKPDVFVSVGAGPRNYTTTVVTDASGSVTWNQIVATVTTAELDSNFSITLLDQDSFSGEHVGGPVLDPDYPNDDYMAGFGGLAEYDGLTHTFDLTYSPGLNYGTFVGNVTYQIQPR